MLIRELIERLRDYPEDAEVYAYEGEKTGLVVGERWHDQDRTQEIGFIACGQAFKTKTGRLLADPDFERLADEAERGPTPEQLRAVGRALREGGV